MTAQPERPEAGQWHHLVYTYDSEFARVYADGELMNEEDMIQHGGLDTWPDAGISIGAQWADAATLNGGLRASMFISRVRVHDGVLTDSQIEANYREELAAFTVAPEIPPPPPKPELAGLWRFDDANNLGFDSGLEGNHLDENGGVSFDGDGVIGGALALDGFDGMLTSTEINEDLPVGNGPYTVAAWIRPEEVEARGIVGWGSYGSGRSVNALRIFGDNGFRHYWWGADLDAQDFDVDALGVDLDDGDWHHVAAVYDGEERSLYLNGEFLVSDLPGDNGAVAANFAVGRTCDFCGAGEFFSGWLDDVAVFNIALDEGQLQEIMAGDFSAFLTGGLAGDFNQNQQLDVADVDLLITEMIAGDNPAAFDLDNNNQVDDADLTVWVKDLANTYFGDANLDGEFNSSDLVAVFQDGKFEADVDPAATWAQGDWNGDGVFTSGDFVKAFQDGGFELGPRNVAAVPEPTLTLLATLLSLVAIRQSVRRS
ncbi:MAG: LamG-like jellyroll fold domain-containing protein [Pirellulaceae bacterium]